MKTSNDILAGLLAVKELELVILKKQMEELQHSINLLLDENAQLYALIEQHTTKREEHIGFKRKEEE